MYSVAVGGGKSYFLFLSHFLLYCWWSCLSVLKKWSQAAIYGLPLIFRSSHITRFTEDGNDFKKWQCHEIFELQYFNGSILYDLTFINKNNSQMFETNFCHVLVYNYRENTYLYLASLKLLYLDLCWGKNTFSPPPPFNLGIHTG